MTSRALLDELAQRASHAEPPGLDDATARRMLDHAVEHAVASAPRTATASSPRPRWPIAVAFAAAATCALVVGWFLLQTPAAPVELTRMTLPSGDRLVGADNARFELAPSARGVQLHGGTLLVDARDRFQLATPHLVTIATNTVFSVESDAERSRVQVYRGAVDIEQAGGRHRITAGSVWDSQVVLASASTSRPASLVVAIDELLATAPLAAVSRADTGTARDTAERDTNTRADTDTSRDTAPRADIANAGHTTTRATSVTARETTSTNSISTARATSTREDIATSRDEAPSAEPATTLDQLLARARSELAAGKFADALATTKLAATRGATKGPWRIVAADALRGLERYADAASTYERAASELSGTDAIEAGYTAAYLRFHDLKDPATALKVLTTARIDEPGSPLEERGLALRVRVLDALERRAEARPFAERYLAKFPHTQLRPLMQAMVDPPAKAPLPTKTPPAKAP